MAQLQPFTALRALNFFMADLQAGIGPFLGVFLQARGWRPDAIGGVMTLGGIAAMAATAPAGAVIDATTHKRSYVIVSGLLSLLASGLVLLSQNLWVVAGAQVAAALAGAMVGPAVVGITLGMARQAGFNQQNGRNQAFNHAGNMVGAGLSGLLGWRFGFGAVFGLAALFGLLSVVSVLRIPRRAIDDRAARGFDGAAGGADRAEGFRLLFANRPLLVLAAALALFHLGNAALLPLYGMAIVGAHKGDPAGFVATTIVVAQAVMVVAALVGTWMAKAKGYWLVLLITFLALPLRGAVAAGLGEAWGVFPVQALDGIAAGLQSVAVPGLVARLLDGTGRVNVGQGAVMTAQGLGAALSPLLGGVIAQRLGYPAAFLLLGGISLGSLVLWVGFAPLLRSACAAPPPKAEIAPA